MLGVAFIGIGSSGTQGIYTNRMSAPAVSSLTAGDSPSTDGNLNFPLQKVVDNSDDSPLGGTFSSFDKVVMEDEGILFTADSLVGGSTMRALFVENRDAINTFDPVIKHGMTLLDDTIVDIQIDKGSFTGNKAAVEITFSGGSKAIFEATDSSSQATTTEDLLRQAQQMCQQDPGLSFCPRPMEH